MSSPTNDEYISSMEADSDRVVAALAANPDAPIPWCGDWTVKECAHHVGGLFHILTGVIRGRPTANFGLFKELNPPAATDPGLGQWISEGSAALAETLRSTPTDEPCWTFSPEVPTVAFWMRRSAHETMVHCWDIEQAAGVTVIPHDPALAADGIDEYLSVFVGMMRGLNSMPGAGETAHVHCTDTSGEWFLTFSGAGEQVVTREHKQADVEFRGPAEGLLLYLWGHQNASAAGVEATGDSALAERWRDLVPAI